MRSIISYRISTINHFFVKNECHKKMHEGLFFVLSDEEILHLHMKTPSSIILIITKATHFCLYIFILGVMVIT